jgi:GH25 family lysozyme M1 (1,4-beta-N-acetylmuramidase)
MTSPSVIDISNYQSDIDLAAAKDGGLLAAIFKCTEGSTLADQSFAKFRDAANKIGLPWCSYHYLHHGSIMDQISFYLRTLKPRRGERVCIDYEDNSCTLDDLREAVRLLVGQSFLADLALQITVYSGHLLKEQLGDETDPLLANFTSLWVAQYTTASAPVWPPAYKTWSLWQHTDAAQVTGYGAPVDGDVFNGPDENLIAWIGPASDAPHPMPAPPVQEPTVQIALTATAPAFVQIVPGENVTLVNAN